MTKPVNLENGKLRRTEVDQYWANGYLFPIPIIQKDEALAARARFEAIEAKWLDNGLPQPLATYKRVNAHLVMPMAAEMGQDARILDVVECILGPDIMIYSAEFFVKEPNSRHIVSMHQDLTYWGMGEIDGLVTAWIPLSPATPASGCMDFVKGSHKNRILPHADTFSDDNLLSRGQEIKVEVAEKDKVAAEIHPGQMSLHHGLTIHGSGPNQTDDRRIALVVRYVAPSIRPEHDAQNWAMLVRGQDRYNHFTHVSPPRTDFAPKDVQFYDKVRIAQAKVTMAGAESAARMYS